jgi:hypothetical protein
MDKVTMTFDQTELQDLVWAMELLLGEGGNNFEERKNLLRRLRKNLTQEAGLLHRS